MGFRHMAEVAIDEEKELYYKLEEVTFDRQANGLYIINCNLVSYTERNGDLVGIAPVILLDVDSGFKDSLKMVDKAISDKIKSRIHRIKDEITGSRLAYYTDFFWEKCSKQSYVDYIEKLKKELESTKSDLKEFKQEVDLEKGLKQISM